MPVPIPSNPLIPLWLGSSFRAAGGLYERFEFDSYAQDMSQPNLYEKGCRVKHYSTMLMLIIKFYLPPTDPTLKT